MNYYNFGAAYIFKKKECNVRGKLKEYYKIIDYVFGCLHDFDFGPAFVCLSKNFGTLLYPTGNKTIYGGFKNFTELEKENNNDFDLDAFSRKYASLVGTYWTLVKHTGRFHKISDPKILECIEETGKKYDEVALNNDKDISKMYASIKETIISQDEQIMAILTTLFKNQKVINSSLDPDMIKKLKENLIVYGPTGTGKTEILTQIAKIYNVPIVIEDSTSLSETGFVGREIQDMLKDLYMESDKNIELAQKGILVLDEFDKLAEKKQNSQDHVSRNGVQRSLLKLLDGTTYYFDNIKFNTSNLSIVALGAFSGISEDENYHKLTAPDFVNYGIMRELMGRFSKLVAMHSLTKEDIKHILVNSNYSPINTYHALFKNMNIKFTYDDEFIEYIAERAIKLKSGARSLKTIFDDVISGAMFRIFAGDYSAIHLTNPKYEDGKAYVLTKK